MTPAGLALVLVFGGLAMLMACATAMFVWAMFFANREDE